MSLDSVSLLGALDDMLLSYPCDWWSYLQQLSESSLVGSFLLFAKSLLGDGYETTEENKVTADVV